MRSHVISTMDRVAVLKDVPLFATLEFDHLVVIASACEDLPLDKDAQVFIEGDMSDALYVVLEGRVQIYLTVRGRQESLTVMRKRDMFGEMAMFDAAPRHASARAAEDTVLLKLTRAAFEEVMTEHAVIALHSVRLLAARVQNLTARLEQAHVAPKRGQTPSGAVARKHMETSFQRYKASDFQDETPRDDA